MKSLLPDTVPDAPPARKRRRFVPRLSDDPDTRSIQVGIVATLIVHLLLVIAVPKHLLSDANGNYKPRYHEEGSQFNIELTPEQTQTLEELKPQPKPIPNKFVETNPDAPINEPDKTNNFGAQSQQAAQEKPAKNTTGDHPEREGRKDIESTQIVTGTLAQPTPPVAAPPPTPETQQKEAKRQSAAREQNPLPGIEKDMGDNKDAFGSNIAKIARNPQDVPKQVEGTPDAPLVEGALGTISIDPHHPRPRPQLNQHRARPAIFQDNQFGTSNIGPAAYDARWSNYGQYLQKMLETIQIQWEKLILDGKTYPAPGSVVHVKFVINSNGQISKVLDVQSGSAGQQAEGNCVAAITLPAPYGKWTDDMVSVLGTEQEMTFVFYYQ